MCSFNPSFLIQVGIEESNHATSQGGGGGGVGHAHVIPDLHI